MKAVFLLFYVWHHFGSDWDSKSQMGGPALTVSPMPSLAVCEAVGRLAKEFADGEGMGRRHGGPESYSRPAVYRCVEVPK